MPSEIHEQTASIPLAVDCRSVHRNWLHHRPPPLTELQVGGSTRVQRESLKIPPLGLETANLLSGKVSG
jgi:hypothetical protein